MHGASPHAWEYPVCVKIPFPIRPMAHQTLGCKGFPKSARNHGRMRDSLSGHGMPYKNREHPGTPIEDSPYV